MSEGVFGCLFVWCGEKLTRWGGFFNIKVTGTVGGFGARMSADCDF